MQASELLKPYWLILIILLAAPPAFASPQIILESRIEQRRIELVDGRKQVSYVPADATTPGSSLRITLFYRNSGDEAAKDVVLNNPIPAGMTYLNGSATTGTGMQTEFSIDGGESYKKPALLTYEIPLPDGSREMRVASPEQYTHIRWRIEAVPPGASGSVSFEALVR